MAFSVWLALLDLVSLGNRDLVPKKVANPALKRVQMVQKAAICVQTWKGKKQILVTFNNCVDSHS